MAGMLTYGFSLGLSRVPPAIDRSLTKEDIAFRYESAGPRRKQFNWDVPEGKRAILACLVSGVYKLQYDNEKGYTRGRALAPPWWESHNYELAEEIRSKDNAGINGAVFMWNHLTRKHQQAPTVVLAFRGAARLKEDYALHYQIVNHNLHRTERFTSAYSSLRKVVELHGRENVCIAGHSLGASLALSAARKMASEGVFVEAHLFNPVFPSSIAPLRPILGATAYSGLVQLYTLTKAGLVNLVVDESMRRESEADFAALRSWYPDLYVHRNDPVCSGFLEHFMSHEYMLPGCFRQLVMPHQSIRGVLYLGSARPDHRIPSARLHVPVIKDKLPSMCPEEALKQLWSGAREAHSLSQWWSDELLVDVQHVSLVDVA